MIVIVWAKQYGITWQPIVCQTPAEIAAATNGLTCEYVVTKPVEIKLLAQCDETSELPKSLQPITVEVVAA